MGKTAGHTLARLGCLLLTVLAMPAARAQAWEVVPEARIAAETNDNPRLLSDDAIDAGTGDEGASRLLAEFRLALAKVTQRGELEFEGAVRSDAYADVEDKTLESTDTFLRSAGQHRWERAVLGFSADLAHEKILGAEALDVPGDTEDPVFVDGVLLGLNERRTRAVLSPYTEIELGERGTARLDLRAMDVSYDDATMLTTRMDFTDLEAGAAYIRRVSSRGTLAGRIFGSRYEVPGNGNVTNTAGVEMNIARTMSDAWSVAATVGFEYSEFGYLDATAFPVTGTEDGFVLGLGLRKRTELASLNVDLRRRLHPDSFGFLSHRKELVVTFLRDLSPTLTGGIVVRAAANEPLGSTIDAQRDYGRLELNLDWAFAELWSLVAGYEHASWQNAGLDQSARSDGVVVGFNYRGRSRRSRTN